jgi:hypothetical protein
MWLVFKGLVPRRAVLERMNKMLYFVTVHFTLDVVIEGCYDRKSNGTCPWHWQARLPSTQDSRPAPLVIVFLEEEFDVEALEVKNDVWVTRDRLI